MDVQLNHRMTHILFIIVIGATVCLLFHTNHYFVGLLLLLGTYVLAVFVRNYIMKVNLQSKAGMLCLIFQLAIASLISIGSESFFAQIYILVLVGEFSFHHRRSHSLLFTMASYVSCVLGLLVYRQFPPFQEIFYLLPRIVEYFAIFGISLLAKMAVQQKNQLVKDNEQLRIASIELEKKVKLQERTRISREIHDSVGHTLTAALTGLQTATYAIEKNNYDIAKDMIDRTKGYIRSGLDDVRSSVHLLHEHWLDQPFIPELIKLIDETKLQTQVDIIYDIDTHLPDLLPMTELTIYRALQEGLTNGIRHGSSTAFYFLLNYRDGHIQFRLSDNGRFPSHFTHGFGLKAMSERVKEIGGELLIMNKSSESGVTLDISIPFPTKSMERSDQHF
ncbi:signal transduction histidine kinase [Paenibacillus endophyticus]|uniref:histidine kinase n=1 Tax=Paenibacillus endophyticus TaxID=1294268 RepID=A0A7W5CCU9_9BACL|nr:sensor histidine kinase [Paenibacillus endophyticus]MBB3154754.1 signal transduction histidine kinase [Paenibacillus endophyticus]